MASLSSASHGGGTHAHLAAVHGDREAPLFEGYTCPKGRALPAVHANPGRLLHSLRRRPDARPAYGARS